MAHSKCARAAQADLDEIQAPTVHLSPEVCSGEHDNGDGSRDDSFDAVEESDFLKRLAQWTPPPPVEIAAPRLEELDPHGQLSPEQNDEAATLIGYNTPGSIAEAVGLVGRALGTGHDAAARAWARKLNEEQFKFLSTGFWLRYEDILDCEPWREAQERRHQELARLFWTLEATGRDVEFLRDSLTHAEDHIAGR